MTDSSDYKEMYTTLQQLSKGYVPNNEKRDKLLSITRSEERRVGKEC